MALLRGAGRKMSGICHRMRDCGLAYISCDEDDRRMSATKRVRAVERDIVMNK